MRSPQDKPSTPIGLFAVAVETTSGQRRIAGFVCWHAAWKTHVFTPCCSVKLSHENLAEIAEFLKRMDDQREGRERTYELVK